MEDIKDLEDLYDDANYDEGLNCSNCQLHLQLLTVDELSEEAMDDGCICILFASQSVATKILDHRYGCEGYKKKIDKVVLH